jgi:peptidoglycan/xylan/chitin deacetylase (PgdA/CDA1 family)/SAM-dependent methyltransferase
MTAIKELTARLLCAIGVPALARTRRSNRLAILMFHGVEGEPIYPRCDYVIDAATLRRDLDYVRRHFTVLPLEEAIERLRDGTLPRRAATVTFDDGTRNLATHAAPVLRELGVPAAVFLATGPMGTAAALWPDRLWLSFARTTATEVDLSSVGLGRRPIRSAADRDQTRDDVVQLFKKLPDAERLAQVECVVAALGPEPDAVGGPFEMLSWDEARTLAKDANVTLYPHTVTHPILSRCSDEKVDYEISESCHTVARETGVVPTGFAYPNGTVHDFDDRAKALLRRNGIRWALSTTNGFADAESDVFELPRMGFGGNQSFAVFRLKVSGFALRPPRLRAASRRRSARPPVEPAGDTRTPERVRAHYEIEKELAAALRTASREERRRLYGELYDELFRRVPDHPQLSYKRTAAESHTAVQRQLTMLERFIDDDATYLEVGPGDCALTFEVAKRVRRAIGVDVSAEITSVDQRPRNFELALSDGTSIPVPPGSVDVAYSNQLMEHLHPEDAHEQLVNLSTALRPGGAYVCVTPNRLTGPHDVSRGFDTAATGFHLREYTNVELIDLLRDCGFGDVAIYSTIRGRSFRVPTAPLVGFERWLLGKPPARVRTLMARPMLAKVLDNCRLVAIKA